MPQCLIYINKYAKFQIIFANQITDTIRGNTQMYIKQMILILKLVIRHLHNLHHQSSQNSSLVGCKL